MTERAGSARLWAGEDRNEQPMVDWSTPLADAYAHATLARSPPQYRQWPREPRTVQVLSGAGGRAFLHGLSVRRAERVTSESCPWCGTLAWGQSASLETTVRRRKSRCRRLGPCRVGRAGSSTSTDRKPRRSWRRCVVACNAAVRSARELGATRSSADWDWKARFAPKAAPRNAKTVPDTFFPNSPQAAGVEVRQSNQSFVTAPWFRFSFFPAGYGGAVPVPP